MQVFPDYYKKFKCIASACRHNCCIGWEIDIDEQTLAYYQRVDGDLGKALKKHISLEDTPHFVLGEKERCPFLSEQNLCKLIISLGKEHLCSVCAEHPRFHVTLPDRTESGLGLCCEAAGALILGQKTPMTLCGACDTQDSIILCRDQLILLLQDRTKPIAARLEDMLHYVGATLPQRSMEQWAQLLLSLERLDDAWTERLGTLKSVDTTAFDQHMTWRQSEYEQLAVYFLYRHFAGAETAEEMRRRAAFVAFAVQLLHTLGALQFKTEGDFTFEDQVELARLFSSEIEYSDENLEIILNGLARL